VWGPCHWIIGTQPFNITMLSRNVGFQLSSNPEPHLGRIKNSTNRCRSLRTRAIDCRSAVRIVGSRVMPWTIVDFPSFTVMFGVCEHCLLYATDYDERFSFPQALWLIVAINLLLYLFYFRILYAAYKPWN